MASSRSVYTIADDPRRDIAVFINDFDQEFADALQKLSAKLKRPLRGVLLIDHKIHEERRNSPDRKGVFTQVVCDFSDPAALRAATRQIEDEVLLITCSSDRNQPFLKLVLPYLPNVLGPTEASLDWATNKSKMRAMLGSYDSSLVPKNITIDGAGAENVDRVLSDLSFPMILKPTGLASSILVTRVDNEAELRDALTRSFEVIRHIYERDGGRGDPHMIVEEFMVGDMFTTDVYIDAAGRTWPTPLLRSQTAHALGMEGFYVYRTDNYVTLSPAEVQAGQLAAEEAAHAVCLRSCVAHVELYYTKEGWKIIELGPRAGGQRQDLYDLGYGIDHAYNELLIKVGLEPGIKTERLTYVQTVNIYAPEEGTITAVDGIDEMKRYPTLSQLRIFAKPGTKAQSSSNGGKLIADCLVCNKDYEELEKDVAAVRSMIKITIEKTEH